MEVHSYMHFLDIYTASTFTVVLISLVHRFHTPAVIIPCGSTPMVFIIMVNTQVARGAKGGVVMRIL